MWFVAVQLRISSRMSPQPFSSSSTSASSSSFCFPPSGPPYLVRVCDVCGAAPACLQRPCTAELLCRYCFYSRFEEDVHQLIVSTGMFREGESVVVGVSGGKDSTVLAHVLTKLNKTKKYKINLLLVAIDEGIKGYRDDSLATVHRNKVQYNLPLHVLSYTELYQGWTMDKVVQQVGSKNNCTFCGVFRRQALERACLKLGVSKLVTGHNADDCAETVLMNLLRGDLQRLCRKDVPLDQKNNNPSSRGLVHIRPKNKMCGCSPHRDLSKTIVENDTDDHFGISKVSLPSSQMVPTTLTTAPLHPVERVKPLRTSVEKEIVMYAHFQKLDYFSTQCTYSPNAYRGRAREFIKELERQSPQCILNILHSSNYFQKKEATQKPETKIRPCSRCSMLCSNQVCKACVLLEGLEKGRRYNIATSHNEKQNQLIHIQYENVPPPLENIQ